jgi:uncharacterized protein YijF (DUF1287 family)
MRLLVAVAMVFCALSAAHAEREPRLEALLAAAAAQIGVTVHYDGSYQRLAYPGGDVSPDRGVCTDVIVRAYRAIGVDLQQLVHDDMRAAFDAYPPLWGMRGTDRNIDHRRVPNLARFFQRQDAAIAITQQGSDYLAGDIVTWRLPSGLPHIGFVASERIDNRPLVIHNIGAGTQREDSLFAFEITGHYRYRPSGDAHLDSTRE